MARAKYCKCLNTYTINGCENNNKKCKAPEYWKQGIGRINGIASEEESSPAAPTPTPAPTPVDPITMQVDFGRDEAVYQSAFPWNNFTTGTSPSGTSGVVNMSGGETIANLTDTEGNSTSLSLEITAPFDGRDANSVAGTELYPHTASRDCWATGRDMSATIQLQNCNAERVYDFTFFSSRGYIGNETVFTIGSNSVSIAHKDEGGTSTGNVTTTASITGVSPDASNNIDINVEGFNSSKLIGYINVLEITER